MELTESRKYNLDAMRVFACFAVVLLHVSGDYISQFGKISPFDWQIANCFNLLTRWCVPVFVMLSGALNLKEKNRDYWPFWIKRLKRFVPVIIFWSGFYLIYTWVNWHVAIQAMLLGNPYYHLYFLFLIVGLYSITPFLVRSITGQFEGIKLSSAILLIILVSTNFGLLQYTFGKVFFDFIPYIGYYLLGAYLAKKPMNSKLM